MNIEADFRSAMLHAGIETHATIIADGVIHRVHVEGDKTLSANGWYVLHADGAPAGAFGCNKRGFRQTWRAKNLLPSSELSAKQIAATMEASRQAHALERKRAYDAAAQRAVKIYRAATLDAYEHPYCVRKGIEPMGVYQNHDGVLVVPVFHARDKHLQSVQFIDGDGTKRFLLGGRLLFGFMPLRHSAESFDKATARRIGICEGYSTGCTLAHVLGPSEAMYTAFSAGNLLNLAIALRERYPTAEITVYGDNDENQVGQTAAIKAATAVQGFVAIPPRVGADWNDFARVAA